MADPRPCERCGDIVPADEVADLEAIAAEQGETAEVVVCDSCARKFWTAIGLPYPPPS
jgi:uncharacterized protein with PIN domain